MGTRNKAIVIILFVIFVMSGIFLWLTIAEYHKAYKQDVHRHVSSIEYLAENHFDNFTRSYLSRIKGFIKINREIVNAFESRSRENLIKLTSPRYKTLKKENKSFNDIIFILPNGQMFLSMNNKDVYGNDLSSYPIMKAFRKGKNFLSGYSIYNSKLYYVIGTRVSKNSSTLGYMVFLIGTEALNEQIKQTMNSDYAVAMIHREHAPEDVLDTIQKIAVVDTNNPMLKKLPQSFEIEKHIQKIKYNGKSYVFHNKKLYGLNNTQIGNYLSLIDITGSSENFKSFIVYFVSIIVIVSILSTMILYKGFGIILSKIETMNRDLENKVNERTEELEKANEEANKQNIIIKSLYDRFKSMFDEHQSMMVLINPVTEEIIDINKSAMDFFGIDKETAINSKIADYSLMAPYALTEKIKNAERNGFKEYSTKIKSTNGQIYDILVQGTPIKVDGQTLIFTICHDITEKIAIESQLREMNKSLEIKVEEEIANRRQNELLMMQQSKMSTMGEMLSAIIHQWRQPLTILSIMMQDIEDTAAMGTDLDHAYLIETSNEALGQIEYMNNTIDDFRNFITPSKGKHIFDVAESVIDVCRLLIKMIEQEGIRLNLAFTNCDDVKINIDKASASSLKIPEDYMRCFNVCGLANEFKQTVLNIINNARDAHKSGNNISADASITVSVTCVNKNIDIEISDNAGGIDKNVIDTIFEPYITTKDAAGTGIGLYLSKNIIENHMDGKITAHNSDTGAVFTITLAEEKNPKLQTLE
jgi:PAS domain S-box-containing protein